MRFDIIPVYVNIFKIVAVVCFFPPQMSINVCSGENFVGGDGVGDGVDEVGNGVVGNGSDLVR